MNSVNIKSVISEVVRENSDELDKNIGYNEKIVEKKHGVIEEFFEIKEKSVAKMLNYDIGKYYVINVPELLLQEKTALEYYVETISDCLKYFLYYNQKKPKVLVVGLGNGYFASDRLGDCVVDNLIITGLFSDMKEFQKMPMLTAIKSGVLGTTGIETADIIKGIIKTTKPDKVIVVDSLSTNAYDRLGLSFQINSAGIVPGSGIDNARNIINKKNMGVDVISVGIPLVMSVSVSDSENKVERKKTIMTPQNIEEIVKLCGRIVAYSINHAITGYDISYQNQIIRII